MYSVTMVSKVIANDETDGDEDDNDDITNTDHIQSNTRPP